MAVIHMNAFQHHTQSCISTLIFLSYLWSMSIWNYFSNHQKALLCLLDRVCPHEV